MRKMCDLGLGPLSLSNFLVSGDPAAIGYGLVDHFNNASVLQLDGEIQLLSVARCHPQFEIIFRRIVHKTTAVFAVFKHLKQRAARLNHVSGKIVHTNVAFVA